MRARARGGLGEHGVKLPPFVGDQTRAQPREGNGPRSQGKRVAKPGWKL